MDKQTLASYIEHTLLKADATDGAIKILCQEAIKYQFVGVCINPYYVEQAATELSGHETKICTVVGFPLGATSKKVKGYEAAQAVNSGADEVDMVINIGALKSGKHNIVRSDIEEVVKKVGQANSKAIVKVIIEACYLSKDEKITACRLIRDAGAAFAKTSTGFGTSGAMVDDIKLIREVIGEELGIKAAGGIHSFSEAVALIKAGATRIGASAGIQILSDAA